MPIVNVTDISKDHVADAIARMEMDIKTVARSHKGLSSGHLKLLRELQSLTAENAALRNEVDEQARLNGKGAERELALRAKVETLERGNAALEKLIIEAGYIITCFDGKLALCRDPWHQPKEVQP